MFRDKLELKRIFVNRVILVHKLDERALCERVFWFRMVPCQLKRKRFLQKRAQPFLQSLLLSQEGLMLRVLTISLQNYGLQSSLQLLDYSFHILLTQFKVNSHFLSYLFSCINLQLIRKKDFLHFVLEFKYEFEFKLLTLFFMQIDLLAYTLLSSLLKL